MLLLKFNFDWPRGFRDNVWKVWTTTTMLNDKACLSYKLPTSLRFGWANKPFKNISFALILLGLNLSTQSWLITMLPSLIARRWVGRQTLWWPRLKAIHFSRLGPELLVCCLAHRGPTGPIGVSRLFGAQGSPSSGSLLNLWVLVFDSSGCLSWFICLFLMIHWLVRDSPRGPKNLLNVMNHCRSWGWG